METPQDATNGHPLNILLAEDNEMNQLLINMVLSDWNMNAHIAANGKEALALIEKEKFDLVLMDMEMPVMDGFEAISKIRAMEGANARLPIISLSAHEASSEIEKCLAAGADAYISKPFDHDELFRIIQKLTSEGGASNGAPVK